MTPSDRQWVEAQQVVAAPLHWRDGQKLAANQALVRLSDGREGHVCSWPVPPEHRDTTTATRRTKGKRVRVELTTGAYVSCPPSAIVEVLAERRGP